MIIVSKLPWKLSCLMSTHYRTEKSIIVKTVFAANILLRPEERTSNVTKTFSVLSSENLNQFTLTSLKNA